jgi:hypothetical protein
MYESSSGDWAAGDHWRGLRGLRLLILAAPKPGSRRAGGTEPAAAGAKFPVTELPAFRLTPRPVEHLAAGSAEVAAITPG